jgi:hypothetical protein
MSDEKVVEQQGNEQLTALLGKVEEIRYWVKFWSIAAIIIFSVGILGFLINSCFG